MYCTNCGERLQTNDRFCGNCGEEVRSASPPPPAATAKRPSGSGWRIGVLILCVLGVIFIGGIAVGVFVFRDELPFLASQDPPDPAFDKLLPTLQSRTDAPIMLPSSLPPKLKNVAVDSGREGDSYGIVFKTGEPKGILDGYMRTDTPGMLTVEPTSEVEPDEANNVLSSDSIELQDGTEAFIRYKDPFVKGSASAFWEGYFEKDGYTYTLDVYLGLGGDEITRQALSSMVSVSAEDE